MKKLCTLKELKEEDRFINVYNWGDYIIRYRGEYIVGGYKSRFCSYPIFPLDNIKTTFPDDATFVQFSVDKWLIEEEIWQEFGGIFEQFPGGYCYRSSGTLLRPRFAPILCP